MGPPPTAAGAAVVASGAIRQIHSKNVGYRIEQMKWSNRMDLLVVSNDRGEVIVHNLNLQKIWTHPPPSEDIRIRALDWCPDEKIVAVGYSSGVVMLLDIELQHIVHSFQLESDIRCLSWTQNNREICDDSDSSDNLLDQADVYLPPLPSFNSLSSNAPKTDYNAADPYSKKVLNMLVVGLQNGIVHLSVFGVLPCGRINVAEHLRKTSSTSHIDLVDAKMCADFRQLQLFVVVDGSKLDLVTLDNEMLPNYLWPLLQLATKHGHILNTLSYIDDIIQCITEAWETALLEMDNKLTKYANSHPDGSVSADFLDLLLFGVPSEPLEEFLTRDLTEKGLKKLGSSIEISYSTIQKLVIKPLHSGILNVCYHLSQIKGMSRNEYYYKPILGAPNNSVIQNAGAFLIKSLELQQTIEQSTRDYKIFWCWLYGVVIRLMDEVVPDDIAAVSQQDTIYLAEFLNNFDTDPNESANAPPTDDESNVDMSAPASPVPQPRKRFNLERVGQYLQNEPLQIPHALDLTQKWDQLLAENECLRECEMIYPYEPTFSLVQQHNLLKDGIAKLFSEPEQLIGKRFCWESSTEFSVLLPNHLALRTSHVNNVSERISLFAVLISWRELTVVEIVGNGRRAVKLEFTNRENYADKFSSFGSLELRDVQFYNNQTLSLLLANSHGRSSENSASSSDPKAFNCFVQFPIANVRSRMVDCTQQSVSQMTPTSLYELLDPQLIRQLDGSDAATVSVSGTRKVATILSESQKRIRVFEMEVDEEEDDDDLLDMSQQSSVGHDMSQESTVLNVSN